MRRFVIVLAVLLALGALFATGTFVLESFRAKGDISLRPREKPGMKFTVTETLAHGVDLDEIRWSAAYSDEIVGATGGRPTTVRRWYASYEMDAQGPPHPTPLATIVLLDSNGARLESNGQPFTIAPTSWPDPFYGCLPDRPVHHSSQWDCSAAAAIAVANFLARAPATSASMTTKLDDEVSTDGIEGWRLRSRVDAQLEDGRTLRAWGDLSYDKKAGLLFDLKWHGMLDGEKGEQLLSYDRTRRVRK